MKNCWLPILLILTTGSCSVKSFNLEVGNTVDLLKSYGFLHQIWDFNQNSTQYLEVLYNIFNESQSINQGIVHNEELYLPGIWHVEMCDNWSQVLNSLLRNYKLEPVDNIQKAFLANWSNKNIAGFLGLSEPYLDKRYTYLLIKYEQHSRTGKFSDGQFQNTELLDAKLSAEMYRLGNNDERATLKFINQYGSHYVSSYTYGDVVFQIFVLDNKTGEELKKKKKDNEEKQFQFELEKYGYMYAHKIGDLKTLSGDKYLETLLKCEPNCVAGKSKRNIIYHMYNNSQLLKYRMNKIPVQLKLFTISNLIKDKEKSTWLQEYIDNQLKLRELYV